MVITGWEDGRSSTCGFESSLDERWRSMLEAEHLPYMFLFHQVLHVRMSFVIVALGVAIDE